MRGLVLIEVSLLKEVMIYEEKNNCIAQRYFSAAEPIHIALLPLLLLLGQRASN